jgi:RNA polymerase sigma-70 factor (subfamily 1)
MTHDDTSRKRTPDQFRSYLLLLARMQLETGPRNRIDPSDIVQQTLLEAHAHLDQFSGDDSALAAWLRQALTNNLRDAWRALKRDKRDVRREQSLEEAVEHSSVRLAGILAAPHSSPASRPCATRTWCGWPTLSSSCPTCNARRSSCTICKAARCPKPPGGSARPTRPSPGCCIAV